MKKILKYIIIIFVLFICNIIRNTYIFYKVSNIGKQTIENANSYHIVYEYHLPNHFESEINDYSINFDIKYKNKISLIKRLDNGNLINIIWKDNNFDKKVEKNYEKILIPYGIEYFLDNYLVLNMKDDIDIKEFIKLYAFRYVKSDSENYIIKINDVLYYYDKKDGILNKSITNEFTYSNCIFEITTVDDIDIAIPDDI